MEWPSPTQTTFPELSAVALSLVDSWGGVGADGALPAAHNLEAEQVFAGLV